MIFFSLKNIKIGDQLILLTYLVNSDFNVLCLVKFIYSERATKFCEISTLLLSVCTEEKSKVGISQNFVAFSEYTNFIKFRTLTIFSYFLPAILCVRLCRQCGMCECRILLQPQCQFWTSYK